MSELQPRQYAVAYCSKGLKGLILSSGKDYLGNDRMAWTGIQLRHDTTKNDDDSIRIVRPGDPWSSSNPDIIGYIEDFYITLQPKE